MADFFSLFTSLAPEFLLVFAALVLLLTSAFGSKKLAGSIHLIAVGVLVLAAVFSVHLAPSGGELLFGGVLLQDKLALFGKVSAFCASALALLLAWQYFKAEDHLSGEFAILVLFAALGMSIMVSANDLLSMYIGIEMQSLALYILAASNRDSLRSTESGLKYFVLGALSSGLLLYGSSLIYGFSGSTSFAGIASAASQPGNIGLIVGLVFLLCGLAFKVSAVPFHMWTPDVYEGAPTPVTAFFATAPKIAAIILLARILGSAFSHVATDWSQVVIAISVLSMVVGYLGAIMQQNIKRLMAYSSIANMGYALIALATGSINGVASLLFYMGLYLVTTLGLFACILALRTTDGSVERLSDLAGLSKTRPGMAISLTLLLFSVAGIPPLAGFFGKYFVFMAAVEAGLLWLALIGAVASVIGAFVYLRLIKNIWFDEPQTAIIPAHIVQFVIAAFAAFAMLPGAIWLLPSLMQWAELAAASFMAHG